MNRLLPEKVPYVTNAKIIVSDIYYNDEIFEYDDKVISTVIENIPAWNLKNCILLLIEGNIDVTFETFKYSLKEEKLTVYAYEKLNLSVLDDVNTMKYFDDIRVLEEIKKVLSLPTNEDPELISISSISNFWKTHGYKYYSLIKKYQKLIEGLIYNKVDKNLYIRFEGYNNLSGELKIEFHCANCNVNFKRVLVFSKDETGKLYIKDGDYGFAKNILSETSGLIYKLFDAEEKYHSYKLDCSTTLKAENCDFEVILDGMNIAIKGDYKDLYKGDFMLRTSNALSGYYLKTDSSAIEHAIVDKEDEIFKRIYVKIEDCPDLLKEKLNKIRYEEITEPVILVESREKALKVKSKVLSLNRKIKRVLR